MIISGCFGTWSGQLDEAFDSDWAFDGCHGGLWGWIFAGSEWSGRWHVVKVEVWQTTGLRLSLFMIYTNEVST